MSIRKIYKVKRLCTTWQAPATLEPIDWSSSTIRMSGSRTDTVKLPFCALSEPISQNHGCKVNGKNPNNGSTAMHDAASLANQKIVRILIKNGADVNALDSRGDEHD